MKLQEIKQHFSKLQMLVYKYFTLEYYAVWRVELQVKHSENYEK